MTYTEAGHRTTQNIILKNLYFTMICIEYIKVIGKLKRIYDIKTLIALSENGCEEDLVFDRPDLYRPIITVSSQSLTI